MFQVLCFPTSESASTDILHVLQQLFDANIRPLCFYGAGAMPAPLYPNTHLQWLQKAGKSRYSNDRSVSRLISGGRRWLTALAVIIVRLHPAFLLRSLPLETFYTFCRKFLFLR